MTRLEVLEKKREGVLEEMSHVGDMRRGTLQERYLRCGRKGCHCARPGSRGHGPKYSLTWKVGKKTRTEYFRADQVPHVEEQLAHHKQFLVLCRTLIEINEEICQLRLKEEEKKESSKKNSSKRSRRKSRKKSTPS